MNLKTVLVSSQILRNSNITFGQIWKEFHVQITFWSGIPVTSTCQLLALSTSRLRRMWLIVKMSYFWDHWMTWSGAYGGCPRTHHFCCGGLPLSYFFLQGKQFPTFKLSQTKSILNMRALMAKLLLRSKKWINLKHMFINGVLFDVVFQLNYVPNWWNASPNVSEFQISFQEVFDCNGGRLIRMTIDKLAAATSMIPYFVPKANQKSHTPDFELKQNLINSSKTLPSFEIPLHFK